MDDLFAPCWGIEGVHRDAFAAGVLRWGSAFSRIFFHDQRFLVHDDAVYAHAVDAFAVFDDDRKGHVTREVRPCRLHQMVGCHILYERLELLSMMNASMPVLVGAVCD